TTNGPAWGPGVRDAARERHARHQVSPKRQASRRRGRSTTMPKRDFDSSADALIRSEVRPTEDPTAPTAQPRDETEAKDDGQKKKGWACQDTQVALRAPTAQPRDGRSRSILSTPSRKGRGSTTIELGLATSPTFSPGSAATMGGSSRSSSVRNDASASWSRSTKSIQSEATNCASSHAQSKSVSIESNWPEVHLTASMVSRVAESSHTAAHDEGSLEEKCSESESDSTAYDTIGLRSSDKPTSGGVARDAAKSIGVVSEITAPLHYIPTPSISVPGVPLRDEFVRDNDKGE
ncbi:hypothetical protein THAOC_36324, partial [Thalassiosira oceanica]